MCVWGGRRVLICILPQSYCGSCSSPLPRSLRDLSCTFGQSLAASVGVSASKTFSMKLPSGDSLDDTSKTNVAVALCMKLISQISATATAALLNEMLIVFIQPFLLISNPLLKHPGKGC